MNILYIYSDEIALNDMHWALYKNGLEPDVYPGKIKIMEYSEEEKESLQNYMQHRAYDVVMTYNFSMAVAAVCKELKTKYISWVFDSPQTALYTEFAKSEYNYIFVFDKKQYMRMKREGLIHLYHLPLAANVDRTSGLHISEEDEKKYSNDISFVGNLYQENGYNEKACELTEEMGERINGIIQKIALHWGRGYECFDVLDYDLTDRIFDKLHLYINKDQQIDKRYMLELYLLSRKISEIDRTCILNALAMHHNVTLYTDGDTSNLQNVHVKGKISYQEEMPKVFYLSKINLNITMRSIETGIPQRVFDIMSVGGFVISNYQEELAELFEPDKEVVLFQNVNELIEKVNYYLAHEEERIRIAMNGYKKVRDYYNTVNAVKKMLDETEKENKVSKTYAVVYHEAASEKEIMLAQRIRDILENENVVYFIGIGEQDTCEDCMEAFFSFAPDTIIIVNGAGFELVREDGKLLYDALGCEYFHVFTDRPESYGDSVAKHRNAAPPVVENTKKPFDGHPLISVVIPTYNREKVLKSAMESVLNQSYTNLELIIADDCSTDQTEALVRDMMRTDERIKYIRSEKNLGAGGARNMGASIARGAYIAFNDSDDLWFREKLQKQLEIFKLHEEENPGMVFHAFLVADQNQNVTLMPFENIPEGFEKESMMLHLLRDPMAGTPAMMLTMEAWKESGGFNENLKCLEDYEFSLRIAEKNKMYYFHEPLFVTGYSAGSVNQNWKEGIKTYFYILEEFADWYRANEFLKCLRICLMWDACGKMGESEFFEERFRLYAKTEEGVKILGQQMQRFIEEHTTLNREWDIRESG